MPIDLLQPDGWERPRGYAYGVAARGRLVCVSGMIGAGPDFVSQVRDALGRIVAVLAEGGARPEHIVRMTWYVIDRAEYTGSYEATGKAYREIIGRHYPAMTAVEVSALIEPHARVEIEVTAVVPDVA